MTETLARGTPGMRSVHDMKVVQDGPPPGGFPSVRFGRRIPNTGPTGTALFGVSTLVIAYGFYKVGQGNHKRRALKEEKMAARKAIAPVLQAEEDRRYALAAQEARKAEAQVMAKVPGWVPGQSQYNSSRWTPPALSLRPNPATS